MAISDFTCNITMEFESNETDPPQLYLCTTPDPRHTPPEPATLLGGKKQGSDDCHTVAYPTTRLDLTHQSVGPSISPPGAAVDTVDRRACLCSLSPDIPVRTGRFTIY